MRWYSHLFVVTFTLILASATAAYAEEAEQPPAAPEAGASEEQPGESGEGEGETAAPEAGEGEPGEGEAPTAGEGEPAEGETPATSEEEVPAEGAAPEAGSEIAEDPWATDAERDAAAEGESEEPPAEAAPALPPPEPEVVEEAEAGDDDAEDEDDDEPSETDERQWTGGEQTYTDGLPFRGTSLIWENIFNAYQLDPSNDPTHNPYYAMSLSIRPRWYFTDHFSARLRLDIEGELTDADSTTDYHETRVSDLTLSLVYSPVVTIPVLDIALGLGLNFSFPTSLQSQAETRYLGLGGSLSLSRVFDLLDGFVISYSFGYSKYLNRYTTMQRDTNPYSCSAAQPDCLAHHQLGTPSRSHGFNNNITLSLSFLEDLFRPMSFTAGLFFINYLAYDMPGGVTIEDEHGNPLEVMDGDDPQNHRAAIGFVLDLGLKITDYLGLSVGAMTMWPQLAPDSTYRQPFFNRYTNIYVDLSLDLERLVAAFRR